jgi:hypothetical protein
MPGSLNVYGNFMMKNGATVELHIYSQSVYDIISVQGSVTFTGRLLVDLNGFIPRVSANFTVMSWSGRGSGQFAEVVGTDSTALTAYYQNGNMMVEIK